MSTTPTFEELFDPDFLTSLTHLSITARRVAAGGRFGEKLSRDLGSGMEFRDYRPYTPGDDLRRIDWNIYSRLGRVFLRLYEEQQDMPLYVMPDLSASMYSDDAVRIKAALKTALAMAAISMNQNDTAGLVPFGDELDLVTKGETGKVSIMRFARYLALLQPRQNTDLAKSLDKLASLNLRPGLLVIVSDFFDPAGLKRFAAATGKVRHKQLFIQITRPADANPGLEGELRLRDCETGEVTDIAMTPAVMKRYRGAYDRFCNELTALAKRRRAGLLRLDAEQDVVKQLATLFETGSLAA